MSNVLEVKNISKRFGRREIIKNITFNLQEGRVLGILGPNGNGKTTLLNIIAGFLKVDSGKVAIDEIVVGVDTKLKVSFLQEKNVLSSWMTVHDAIVFYEEFFQDFNKDKALELLEFMKVDKSLKIKSLSKGMLEKLNLTLTLSRKARLYILDEPISGVDLVSREKILKAIIDNVTEDSSIIITTHFVGELENIFDEVAFMNEGEIVEINDSEELREKYGKSIEDIYKHIFAE